MFLSMQLLVLEMTLLSACLKSSQYFDAGIIVKAVMNILLPDLSFLRVYVVCSPSYNLLCLIALITFFVCLYIFYYGHTEFTDYVLFIFVDE